MSAIFENLKTMRIQNNISFAGDTKLNMFYFSDFHGDIPAYKELKTASDEFDRNHQDSQNLKLAGGDVVTGKDEKKRLLVYRILKTMNIDASAVGNHEWDKGTDFYEQINELHKKAPNLLFDKFICGNTKNANMQEFNKEGLFNSKVIVKNGEKYGIVGATTNEYDFKNCKVDNIEESKKDITSEIQNLKQKNPDLNKFIVVSHLGINADREIAKTVPDIDIIVGGHSHTLIQGVEQDKNLFMSSKNEPVLVVQAGNERYFGELQVEFDKDGKLNLSEGHKPVNKTASIFDYQANSNVKDIENGVLGATSVIGSIKQAVRTENPLTQENPLGSLEADAILDKTNADCVLINAGSFRAFLNAGEVTQRDIEYCLPFSNEVMTLKLTGKDIANVLSLGVNAVKKPEQPDPGLFQVAGMKYTVSADKKLTDVYIVDKNGNKSKQIVDVQGNLVPENDPAHPYEYTVALTDHVLKRFFTKIETSRDYVKKEGCEVKINKQHIIKEYEPDRDILTDYLKHNFTDKNKPVDFKNGRITIENQQQEKTGIQTNYSFLSLINRAKKTDYSLPSSITA